MGVCISVVCEQQRKKRKKVEDEMLVYSKIKTIDNKSYPSDNLHRNGVLQIFKNNELTSVFIVHPGFTSVCIVIRSLYYFL